jgi:hypothetical protein
MLEARLDVSRSTIHNRTRQAGKRPLQLRLDERSRVDRRTTLSQVVQTGGVLDVRADIRFDEGVLVVWSAASAGIWVALAAWWVEPTSSS